MREEYAIQQTLNTYSECTSRADDTGVLATFTADGIWQIPGIGAKFEGRKAIAEGMATIRAQFAYVIQVNAPAVITIDGDRATARSVIHETGKLADRDETLDILGAYHDDLVRTQEGWKFTCRTFHLAGMYNTTIRPVVLPG